MNLFIILTIIICIFIYYINNNKKERFENSDSLYDKVYISFTTIPSRIAYIDEMLKSVDIPEVYEIHLNLENHLNYDEYHVERLKKITPKLKVFRINEKLGPLTKIVPTLERLLGTNSLVISVDDDTNYNNYIIKNLINSYVPNIVIGTNGSLFGEYSSEIKTIKKHYKFEDIYILAGGYGVLYPTNIMKQRMLNEMKELSKLSKECYKSDDFTINFTLEKYNIRRTKISNIIQYEQVRLNYYKKDALHTSEHDTSKFIDGNASNYYYCANLIIDKEIL